MAGPAQSRGLRKGFRDLLQAIAAAASGGGAVLLIDAVTGEFEPAIGVGIGFIMKIIFAYLQNYLETKGSIGVLLPTPGLITEEAGGTVTKAVGTVDTVAETAGAATGVVGDVVNTAGELVGSVTGTVTGILRKGD
jgi:hypothetical protein